MSHEPATAGAERDAQRHLVTPSERAREQQVADVRAGDEQDDANGAEEKEQGPLGVANQGLAQRRRVVAGALILVGELALELFGHRA